MSIDDFATGCYCDSPKCGRLITTRITGNETGPHFCRLHRAEGKRPRQGELGDSVPRMGRQPQATTRDIFGEVGDRLDSAYEVLYRDFCAKPGCGSPLRVGRTVTHDGSRLWNFCERHSP